MILRDDFFTKNPSGRAASEKSSSKTVNQNNSLSRVGVNLDLKKIFGNKNINGVCPLSKAIIKGNSFIVNKMIDTVVACFDDINDVDFILNSQDMFMATPLFHAISVRHDWIIEKIIFAYKKSNGDIRSLFNVENISGVTPVMRTIELESTNAIKTIIETISQTREDVGIVLGKNNVSGLTPLMLALKHKKFSVASELISLTNRFIPEINFSDQRDAGGLSVLEYAKSADAPNKIISSMM